jgi:O-methyltransferase
MNRRLDSALRAVFPYRFLAFLRMSQFYLTGSIEYHERADRRVFFYRAFCLLWKNRISGDYAEFGCNGGMTFYLAYEHSTKFFRASQPRRFWAFDSFQGLPAQKDQRDRHPEWNEGWLKTSQDQFVRLCTNAGIPRSAYEMVPGFYEDTIGKNARTPAANLPQDIALAYIDCDLYTSTRSVLEFLGPRLKHGMIIALDDYYSYSKEEAAGERVALIEHFRALQDQYTLVPYVQFGYAGMSFILEDRRCTNQPPLLLLSH